MAGSADRPSLLGLFPKKDEITLAFFSKNEKILFAESWQSGNATDSKSVEPANTGAQVQILYSPYNQKSESCFIKS